ncbi:MAG: restriction endonuclease [bacterium]|nr:restriction endonuclease [bacterium]
MRKRKYYYEDGDSLWRLISGIAIFYFIYLALQYFTNRANFWRWVSYGVVAVIIFVAIIFLWREIRHRFRQKHLNKVLTNLRGARQEEYFKNFINRFGFENTKSGGWSFRNRRFDWDRINDLKKILKEMGVTSKEKDVFALLQFYIQENEEKLTRESIHKKPQKFENLTGTEFEKLLYRLFEAMGYKVELTGRSGDQGGDLIVNKNGERVLIQAKCYRDWSTGNAAVQQVVGAVKYYDCSRAIVITTSHFTKEAIALAMANQTELVSKDRLQGLLLQFLGESWD